MKKRSLPTTHPVGAEVSGKLRKVAPGTADSDANQTDVSASEEGMDLDYSDSDHVFHRQYLRAQLALPSGASRPENSPGAGVERLGAGMDPSIQASLTANPQNTTQSTVLHTNSCSKPLKPSTVEPMESEVPSSQKVMLVEPTMTAPISLRETQKDKAASLTPKTSKTQKIAPKPSPTPSPLTPTASPFAVPKPWKKGRKPGGNRWGSVGKVSKGTKAASAAVTATSSPIPVAMQPELDDVEGLLFVSFTSKVKHDTCVRSELWEIGISDIRKCSFRNPRVGNIGGKLCLTLLKVQTVLTWSSLPLCHRKLLVSMWRTCHPITHHQSLRNSQRELVRGSEEVLFYWGLSITVYLATRPAGELEQHPLLFSLIGIHNTACISERLQ